MSKKNKFHKIYVILSCILVVGFIIRLVYLYFLKDTVYFNPLLMDKHDQKTFIIWAQQILKHPWYVDGKPLGRNVAGDTVWRPADAGFYEVQVVDEAGLTTRARVRVLSPDK